MSAPQSKLIFYADDHWGRLSPVLQSTSAADTLLGNVFEPLVDVNPRGGFTGGSADRWEISPDDRVLRFHIRSGVKFSDGTPLTAELYRKCLLEAVSIEDRDSHNPNSMDVLYRLEGFSIEAAKSGSVSGLSAEGDWLTFKFKSPFRTALGELTGTRYAPWIRKEDNQGQDVWLGTGPYRILSHDRDMRVVFSGNAFAWRKASFDLVEVQANKGGAAALCDGVADGFIGMSSKRTSGGCKKIPVEFLGGAVVGHRLISLHGGEGKVFGNVENRLAFQYLVYSAPKSAFDKWIDFIQDPLDFQFFQAFSPGRLESEEVGKIIEKGREFVPGLIQATTRKPLKFVIVGPSIEPFFNYLVQAGLVFESA